MRQVTERFGSHLCKGKTLTLGVDKMKEFNIDRESDGKFKHGNDNGERESNKRD